VSLLSHLDSVTEDKMKTDFPASAGGVLYGDRGSEHTREGSKGKGPSKDPAKEREEGKDSWQCGQGSQPGEEDLGKSGTHCFTPMPSCHAALSTHGT
jgi:hypothetical protein